MRTHFQREVLYCQRLPLEVRNRDYLLRAGYILPPFSFECFREVGTDCSLAGRVQVSLIWSSYAPLSLHRTLYPFYAFNAVCFKFPRPLHSRLYLSS